MSTNQARKTPHADRRFVRRNKHGIPFLIAKKTGVPIWFAFYVDPIDELTPIGSRPIATHEHQQSLYYDLDLISRHKAAQEMSLLVEEEIPSAKHSLNQHTTYNININIDSRTINIHTDSRSSLDWARAALIKAGWADPPSLYLREAADIYRSKGQEAASAYISEKTRFLLGA